MWWVNKKSFIDSERDKLQKLSKEDTERALQLMASAPVKTYLLSLVDELVRQGIYLDEKQREGAKFMVELLGSELEKGTKLLHQKKK